MNAFPLPASYVEDGMSLRDYFAAASLTGIKANDALLKRIMDICQDRLQRQQDYIATMAYADADAMITARDLQTASLLGFWREWYVDCTNELCRIQPSMPCWDTPETAVKVWNTRNTETKQ